MHLRVVAWVVLSSLMLLPASASAAGGRGKKAVASKAGRSAAAAKDKDAAKAAEEEAPLDVADAVVTETAIDLSVRDPAYRLAESYLKALTRQGSEQGLEELLGGATFTARFFTLENWRIVGREKHRSETGELLDIHVLMAAVEVESKDAYGAMLDGNLPPAENQPQKELGYGYQELSAEDVDRALGNAKRKAAVFIKTHPVAAYIARVDKHVFMSPKNPFRGLVKEAGPMGKYTAEIDLFWIESIEGKHKDSRQARRWPLRVVRFRSGKVDTGLKILPASDWDAE